ncbi:zinc ABC transporter substrate-binding protein [Acetobacteraceae bacterium H6797]|nr:zinc ABC transporter substrate-binding protein [Acetobacteraceae bacterium H6797]
MHRRSLLALPGLLLAARAAQAQAQTQAPFAVTASFSILADMARVIGGDRVAVRSIVGPDADAHEFQPKPSDAVALREAGLIIRNGLGFEPWLDRMLSAAGGSPRVAVATDGITPRMMEDDGHGHGHSHGAKVPDPHAWQDLRNGRIYVRNLATALAAADPAGAESYKANAAAYAARLADLDAWVRAQIATVPAAKRKVVTSHDAFGYFGAAYGVTLLAPQGISTDSEASAADVAKLIRQMRREKITAAFVENMTNPATLDRLAREAGAKVSGKLYADALSGPDGTAPTYEAMFRSNIALLVPAMKGEG